MIRVWTTLRFTLFTLLAVAALVVVSPACSTETKSIRGASPMITYPIGRFELNMPKTFSLEVQSQKLRYVEITESPWPKDVTRDKARASFWATRLSALGALRTPKRIDKVIVDTKELPEVGAWAKGVLYYGNDASGKDGNWDVLVDTGSVAAWFKINGLIQFQTDMLNDVIEIARAYRFGDPVTLGMKGDWFYTEHGAINLPYLEQEKTYARFENKALGLILELDTTEIHKEEVKDHGLLGRLDAVIESGFAGDVKMDHVRRRTRTLAGLDGEELVLRAHDGKTTRLSFTWRFSGRKDSGQQPKIVVDMESPDGQLEEKLKVWDAILDSFKPVGQ